ncbi:MAG: ribosome biogenesis GTP-binding protein YihA/YsxC [Lachnospiraceae bacterium]|nr:ribosome biogenesis GTP-binding protein YihA/YsxC [Lachnospiraceae bacterium]
MIIRSAELETICGPTSALPVHDLPEFAFVGRSNVGKSSLINALMQRKSLARTSSQPGKTRTINFYNINHEFYYTDLPGYGFAKVSDKEKAAWGRMIERYLRDSAQLKTLFILADIRHEPTGNDRAMLETARGFGLETAVIATKADKIKKSQIQKQIKVIRTGLKLGSETPVLPFSALDFSGREAIWEYIESRLRTPVSQEIAHGTGTTDTL